MNANLEWYYTFLATAKHQNFRKAAEELYLTQTTVFHHIKNLESALSIKLFIRNGKNIQLSDVGRTFISIAETTITTYEKGIELIQNVKKGYLYKLKLAVTPYIASYLMPKFLCLFFEKAPHINLDMHVISDNKQIAPLIETGLYDAGIDRIVSVATNVSYKKVCEGSIRLLVPNVAENQDFTNESEFFNKYRILSDNHPVYWKFLKQDILNLAPDSKLVSIQSVDATESLIRANMGVSYLPLYILKNRQEDSLRIFDSQQIPSPVSFTYLLWKRENEGIVTFLDLFENYVRNEQT